MALRQWWDDIIPVIGVPKSRGSRMANRGPSAGQLPPPRISLAAKSATPSNNSTGPPLFQLLAPAQSWVCLWAIDSVIPRAQVLPYGG